MRDESGALFRDVELAARHRTRPIEHQHDPQRRTRLRLWRRGHMQLEHAVHVVVTLDGQQLVIEADRGIHSVSLSIGLSSSAMCVCGRRGARREAHWSHEQRSVPAPAAISPLVPSVNHGCDSYSGVIRSSRFSVSRTVSEFGTSMRTGWIMCKHAGGLVERGAPG